jgi:hypothetical protein
MVALVNRQVSDDATCSTVMRCSHYRTKTCRCRSFHTSLTMALFDKGESPQPVKLSYSASLIGGPACHVVNLVDIFDVVLSSWTFSST